MEIPFPLGGRNDLPRKSSQPPGTTSEAVNVRAIDRLTGRARGAQRSGHSRYVEDPASDPATKIKALTSVVYDSRKLDYAGIEPDTDDSVWQFNAKKVDGVTVLAQDELGNVYGIYGQTTIVKVNPDGKRVWERSLAAPDKTSICRALCLGDGLEVYAATSTGKDLDNARIWRIDQVDDNGTELVWEYQPTSYVEALGFAQGALYAAQNNTLRTKSHVVVYQGVEANPQIQRSTEIPYPVHGMAVLEDGTCYTTHPPFSGRGLDPKFPLHTERTVDWTPRDLDDWENRIWCWLDTQKISADGDDPVLIWSSQNGKRHALSIVASHDAPTYTEEGLAGLPTLSFSGSGDEGTVGRAPCLISGTNKDVQAKYSDQQLTLLPAYKGSQFALILVMRPSDETGASSTSRRTILAQENTAGEDQGLVMNSDHASAVAVGKLHWRCGADPAYPGRGLATSGTGTGTYDYAARGEDAIVISAVYNAGLPPVATGDVVIYSTTNQVISVFEGGSVPTGFVRVSFPTPSGYTFVSGDRVRFPVLPGSITDPGELNTTTEYSILGSISANVHYFLRPSTGSFNSTDNGNYGGCTVNLIRELPATNWVGSTLRVNGNPVDRFYGTPFETYGSGYKGTGIGIDQLTNLVAAAIGTTAAGRMDLAELIVLHNPDYPGRDGPVTQPPYPRTLGIGTGGAGASTPWAIAPNLTTDAQYELLKLEGYAAHRWGISHYLPTGTFVAPTWTTSGSGFGSYTLGNFPHPYSRLRGPPRSTSDSDIIARAPYLVHSPEPMLVKWAADSGKMVWVATGLMQSQGIGYGAGALGGMGYGVVAGKKDGDRQTLFTYGPPGIGLGGSIYAPGLYDWSVARKFIDLGDDYDTGPQQPDPDAAGINTDPWSKTYFDLFGSATPDTPLEVWSYQYGRMDADAADNCYIPVASTSANAQAVIVSANGEFVLTPTAGFQSETSAAQSYAVLAAAPEPEYEDDDWDDLTKATTQRAEFFYVSYADGAHTDLEKIRLAEVTSRTGSPRELISVCVVGGTIRRFTTAGFVTPSGGANALDADSETVSCIQAYGEVFFTDGHQYKVFQPKRDEVAPWRATGAGGIPKKFKYLELWNGRIVLVRGADDPHNWFMSAQGDPYDFDVQPPVTTATQAVAGTGSVGPGRVPDIINTFIPYTDDLGYFGCDHSIYRMTGDPAADGQIDLVSDITGIAYGKSWCKDPSGVLYFFGSRGGVYRMVPGSIPERMTLNRIERSLSSVNLEDFRVELAWDTNANALMVYLIPWGEEGEIVTHFAWEQQADAWWEDRIGEADTMTAPGMQPSCVHVQDGDSPNDRVVLLGCFDGRIRKIDQNAKNDDGVPIDSRVLIGPITGRDNTEQVLWGNPILVLSGEQDGCALELLASKNPDTPVAPVHRVDQGPGRNGRALIRARGAYVWVRLRSCRRNSSWAFESLTLEMLNSGTARAR